MAKLVAVSKYLGIISAATPKDTWSDKNLTNSYIFPKIYKWWLNLFTRHGCIRINEYRVLVKTLSERKDNQYKIVVSL